MDFPLVLAATIDPRGMADLTVADKLAREGQYLETFSFYLAQRWTAKIVFIENSGHDLSKFIDLALNYPAVETELISCNLNDFPREFGKSYGEMQMLDYAVDNSSLLAGSDGFIKVTGRLRILNLNKLLFEARRRQPWVLFCDTKDHPIYDWMRNGWNGHSADTRFYIVTKSFYRAYFYGSYKALNDSMGLLVEMLFFETIKSQHGKFHIICRFKTEPVIVGRPGHQKTSIIGSNDYSSWLAKIKRLMRQLGRWFLPWLWF